MTLTQFKEAVEAELFDLFMDIQPKQTKSQPLAGEYTAQALAAIEVASTVWDAQLPQEVHWLANHLNCSVEVVNEYGETLQEYERKHEALPSDTGPRSATSPAAKSNLTNGGKDE